MNQESVRMLSRVALQGVIRALQSDINIAIPPAFSYPLISEDLLGPAAACVYFLDNRFSSTGWAVPRSVRCITFCLHEIYLSATSHTGRKPCQVKSLFMKRFWLRYRRCHLCGLNTFSATPLYVLVAVHRLMVCKQTHGEEVHTKAGSYFAAKYF